jgi:hypothetical protein
MKMRTGFHEGMSGVLNLILLEALKTGILAAIRFIDPFHFPFSMAEKGFEIPSSGLECPSHSKGFCAGKTSVRLIKGQ